MVRRLLPLHEAKRTSNFLFPLPFAAGADRETLMKTNPSPASIAALTLALASALAALPARDAAATNCTWNPATGNWGTAGNWSCGIVPGAGDSATIAVTRTVTIDTAQSILTLGNAGSVNIDQIPAHAGRRRQHHQYRNDQRRQRVHGGAAGLGRTQHQQHRRRDQRRERQRDQPVRQHDHRRHDRYHRHRRAGRVSAAAAVSSTA